MRLSPSVLALLALLAGPVAAQRHPAYFDDFSYTRIGTPQDAPASGALLGSNEWLVGNRREAMRSWKLNLDDSAFSAPAATYFGGPAALQLLGSGDTQRLRMTMEAGFPFVPGEYTRPPRLETGQLFAPSGTFAARVRFSDLEQGQRLSSAFWLYSLNAYRFCPPDLPDCDPRESLPGLLHYTSEADFEFNNYFIGADIKNIQVGASTYRRFGGTPEGYRIGQLDCLLAARARAGCRDAAGASSFADRWLLLVFRFDPAPLTQERGRSYRGRLAFLAESDDDAPLGTLIGTSPGTSAPFEIWRSEGRDDGNDGRFEVEPVASFMHDPVAFILSIIYEGRSGEPLCPPNAAGQDVTCRPHTLDVDWVYHTPSVLRPAEVRREVVAWRSRGEHRVNTVDVRPTTATPPLSAAGARPAQLDLVLDGPASTARQATWHVRPRTVRSVIHGMDVEVVTRCDARVPACRPRTVRPYAPYFTLAPAPGETGLTIRAKLWDPWYGYTSIPTPGSEWTEWEVRFTR